MTIGDYIIKYREEHGLSQRTFAKMSGISNQTVANIENGIHPKSKKPFIPATETLKAIADCTGITLQELFSMCEGSFTFDDADTSREPLYYTGSNSRVAKIVPLLESCTRKQLDEILAYVEFVRTRG